MNGIPTSEGEDDPELGEDEAEWVGFGDEPEPVVERSDNTADRGGKPIAMPTGHEVRVMKEATELYQSSSFKLKVRRIYSLNEFLDLYCS